MNDRDNIIKVLSNYKTYVFGDKDDKVMVEEIIALLKAQEPVKPLTTSLGTVRENHLCGYCGGSFFQHEVNFCPWCGKAVKWRDR